jgi:hypothetical protein
VCGIGKKGASPISIAAIIKDEYGIFCKNSFSLFPILPLFSNGYNYARNYYTIGGILYYFGYKLKVSKIVGLLL